ncbi:membrane protein [Streptomyces sp. CNQ-509]|uniref:membrane protein n=1 Tax=Streptomyces sp. CNQ-509 TaxID=444103 RepID=UPI00062E06B3|nr:membrane protein [Streptomyces sp. CNQ-509]AKH82143.1 membrane protein [Streptomyces sp. CNQ-509]
MIGAALLLIIASFLGSISVDCPGGADCGGDVPNGWDSDQFPLLPSVFLTGIFAAALIFLGRVKTGDREFGGLRLDQWGTALSAAALLSSLFMLFGGARNMANEAVGQDIFGMGVGLILGLIANLAMAAGAILGQTVPALKANLLSSPGAPAPAAPYGGGQPQPGYGYPGGQPGPGGPGGPQGGAPFGGGQQAPFGGGPGAGGPQPGGPQAGGPAGARPQAQAAPQPAAGGSFAPFWFAVPAARPLFAEDGSSAQIAELTPGIWYLAVDQRGAALVAQTQDGRRGVLQDTTGIQRGA